ncbi:MAG: hypothetical protein KJO04_11095 [Bacteroidia bacterium]|nr:hypothetical protein [Bacteroidia bacterium]
MFKFFRKIRFDLMESGKTGKYLKYAIGEILLVVIGILIALQINTWNEGKKAKVIERELLQQFSTELTLDIQAIENTIGVYLGVRNSCTILISHLKNKESYHDSLSYHFATWNDYEHFNTNSGAISNLNARGVDIISNSDLRNSILKLYNQSYSYGKDIGGFFREDHINFTYPMYLKRIEPVLWDSIAIPNDYDALLDDDEFMNHLQWIRNATIYNLEFYDELVAEIESVILAIETELQAS